MEKDKIHLNDIKRILLGDAPVEFILEVFLRTIIAYIVIIAVVKLLGKRMSGKLTSTEMAVMLMFGALVSGITQIPDRGVIEGIFVLLLILCMQRMVTPWTTKSDKFENWLLGKMQLLIKVNRSAKRKGIWHLRSKKVCSCMLEVLRRWLPPMMHNNLHWLKMSYSFLFSLQGIPMVRYGDEIGMGDDLNLRKGLLSARRCNGTIVSMAVFLLMPGRYGPLSSAIASTAIITLMPAPVRKTGVRC